eukprot:m.78759 g.78759  ORF g.78759 m.78759 type:complete len:194 (-) comp12688_c0_seq1:1656-2237(-)
MFGIIVAGRAVDTACIQTAPDKFTFNIPDVHNVKHITVFMTGASLFPAEAGASIYFGWPGAEVSWQLLGFLTNEKPSAIFKISGTKPVVTDANPFHGVAGMADIGQIGISIEPKTDLMQQTPVAAAAAPTVSDFAVFSEKMLESFFNFASSFSSPREQALRQSDQNWIPIGTLQRWRENFHRKLAADPLFWKK